jgi:hypothetical protein
MRFVVIELYVHGDKRILKGLDTLEENCVLFCRH